MNIFAPILAAAASLMVSTEEPRNPLRCHLNEVVTTCRTYPTEGNGFRVEFDHADEPVFTFTPVRVDTTQGALYTDAYGNEWRMFGHRSIHMVEMGGFFNEIYIENP